MKIAIDPGATGAIVVESDGIVAHPMPDGMTGIVDLLTELSSQTAIRNCWIEDVGGYMPGNSGPAAVTFARHVGNLEAALYALGWSVHKVTPHKWMKYLGVPKEEGKLPTEPAEKRRESARRKSVRKHWIREAMARLYPNIRVTLVNADALGILTYANQSK